MCFREREKLKSSTESGVRTTQGGVAAADKPTVAPVETPLICEYHTIRNSNGTTYTFPVEVHKN
ncbi:hypothetical protein IPM62_01165 [Candidatus Woesebacteria bacterium]|nr:MAG: hypothetical protein IPM62_01165 [Candidatus Woesebacteria bacterium]